MYSRMRNSLRNPLVRRIRRHATITTLFYEPGGYGHFHPSRQAPVTPVPVIQSTSSPEEPVPPALSSPSAELFQPQFQGLPESDDALVAALPPTNSIPAPLPTGQPVQQSPAESKQAEDDPLWRRLQAIFHKHEQQHLEQEESNLPEPEPPQQTPSKLARASHHQARAKGIVQPASKETRHSGARDVQVWEFHQTTQGPLPQKTRSTGSTILPDFQKPIQQPIPSGATPPVGEVSPHPAVETEEPMPTGKAVIDTPGESTIALAEEVPDNLHVEPSPPDSLHAEVPLSTGVIEKSISKPQAVGGQQPEARGEFKTQATSPAIVEEGRTYMVSPKDSFSPEVDHQEETHTTTKTEPGVREVFVPPTKPNENLREEGISIQIKEQEMGKDSPILPEDLVASANLIDTDHLTSPSTAEELVAPISSKVQAQPRDEISITAPPDHVDRKVPSITQERFQPPETEAGIEKQLSQARHLIQPHAPLQEEISPILSGDSTPAPDASLTDMPLPALPGSEHRPLVSLQPKVEPTGQTSVPPQVEAEGQPASTISLEEAQPLEPATSETSMIPGKIKPPQSHQLKPVPAELHQDAGLGDAPTQGIEPGTSDTFIFPKAENFPTAPAGTNGVTGVLSSSTGTEYQPDPETLPYPATPEIHRVDQHPGVNKDLSDMQTTGEIPEVVGEIPLVQQEPGSPDMRLPAEMPALSQDSPPSGKSQPKHQAERPSMTPEETIVQPMQSKPPQARILEGQETQVGPSPGEAPQPETLAPPKETKEVPNRFPTHQPLSDEAALGTVLDNERGLTLQAMPLEAVWPVERVEQPQVVRRSEIPIEYIPPRHPRPPAPVEEPDSQTSPGHQPLETTDHTDEKAPAPAPPPVSESRSIETEIGPLPADLWHLIGQEPPRQASAEIQPPDSFEAAPARTTAAVASLPLGARAPVIQRQEESRTAPAEPGLPESEAGAAASATSSSEEVDVDELARRVYREVKRRMSLEWERMRKR
jgi:hypothetical protein